MMKRRLLAALPCIGLVSCSFLDGHRFTVVAPDAQSAVLTLGNSEDEISEPMTLTDGEWTGGMRFGDASGRIRLTYSDGVNVDCRIGYISDSDAHVHRFVVTDRVCHAVIDT